MNGADYSGDAIGPDSPQDDVTVGSKRKADAQAHTRSKRSRYISIACTECKRRKIRCNGQTPCQRCGNLSLECIYTPNCCSGSFRESEEFKQMNAHITALQESVDTLFANLTSLRNNVDSQTGATSATPSTQYTPHPFAQPMSTPQTLTQPRSPSQGRSSVTAKRFQGPTSAAFNFGVAKSSLQSMGITAAEESNEDVVNEVDDALEPPAALQVSSLVHQTKDPLWAIGKDEAVRLCRVYEEEMGLMYPIIDINLMVRHVSMLYMFIETATKTGLVQTGLHGPDAITDDRTNMLKLVMALALLTEGGGQNDLALRLFDCVKTFVQAKLLGPPEFKTIRLLTLTAMYHFHRDDESMAWRAIGLAARVCMEMGLHRRETYSYPLEDNEDRAAAVRLFWSVYVLDRRWAFGTGLPFAFQDADMDPLLPKPDDSNPYLVAMIEYSNIGSKVWRSVANLDAPLSEINKEQISYLDYQVIQWHRSVPDTLKYVHPDSGQQSEPVSKALHRLRVLLYLRANQMRILIYRPVLHSATSIVENRMHAQTVVNVAKDTIRVLTHVNQTSDIYRTQQVCFNYFLISALAVLFLAVSHAPAQFSDQSRDEFYAALELVRGFSSSSFVSKRLWKTIKGLKEVGPRLGLNLRTPGSDGQDPNHTAAVAMAGLAGHSVDEMALYGRTNGGRQNGSSPDGMANELTSLFEAVGAYSTNNNMVTNGNVTTGFWNSGEVAQAEGSGNDEEISRIMRDLF